MSLFTRGTPPKEPALPRTDRCEACRVTGTETHLVSVDSGGRGETVCVCLDPLACRMRTERTERV